VRNASAAASDPNAIAEADTINTIQTPEKARVDRGAEDQPDRDEPEGDYRAQHRGAGEPASTIAKGDRRREEPIGEAHLDIDRQGDSPGVPREQHTLDHRSGEHEREEALHGRELGRFTARPAPPV
jgi:hypothetical protein